MADGEKTRAPIAAQADGPTQVRAVCRFAPGRTLEAGCGTSFQVDPADARGIYSDPIRREEPGRAGAPEAHA